MKDNEKQAVEEMARILCEVCASDPSPCHLVGEGKMCEGVLKSAEALYNAGYSKQSEVAKSIGKQQEIYNETMARLRRMGKKNPTDVIVALAEEIDRYRDKIRSMEEFITKREGKWNTVVDNKDDIVTECSACKKHFWFMKKGQLNIDKMPYCPECGANMKGGAE